MRLALQPSHFAWQTLTKVPKITAYFWIIKILTTAMGESTTDYLVKRINPFVAVTLGFIALLVALFVQFSAQKYITWVYWLAAAMVSVFGTMAADVLHIQFHVPYVVSTIFYAIVLTIIFVLWSRSEHTLSIHSIYTRRREAYYWLVVLATFALGTAAGDMTAITLHLGYLTSGILFAIVFALPAISYWLFGLNAIFAFWFAYIVTRPFGASFADWVGKPVRLGGLGYGDGTVSIVLTLLIIIFVAYISITKLDAHARPRDRVRPTARR